MTRYLMIKALRSVVSLWIVVTFVFVILRLTGDPLGSLLPDDTPPEIVEEYRVLLGLDKPIIVQYWKYMAALMTGDFGVSFFDNRPAVELIGNRVGNTLLLGGLSYTIAMVFGLAFGIVAAINRERMLDRGVMTVAVMGYSMPSFFLALLLIILFTLELRWLPPSGAGDWKSLVMPVATLSLISASQVARFIRSAMLEVLRQTYIRTANAKGVPAWRTLLLHALPNAAIPAITIMGFQFGYMIGGTVIIETVFSWPGVGRLLFMSVSARDYAVVQAILLLVAASVITVNYLVDVLYGVLDPRIRLPASGGAAK